VKSAANPTHDIARIIPDCSLTSAAAAAAAANSSAVASTTSSAASADSLPVVYPGSISIEEEGERTLLPRLTTPEDDTTFPMVLAGFCFFGCDVFFLLARGGVFAYARLLGLRAGGAEAAAAAAAAAAALSEEEVCRRGGLVPSFSLFCDTRLFSNHFFICFLVVAAVQVECESKILKTSSFSPDGFKG
jgi:hypothetical protein